MCARPYESGSREIENSMKAIAHVVCKLAKSLKARQECCCPGHGD